MSYDQATRPVVLRANDVTCVKPCAAPETLHDRSIRRVSAVGLTGDVWPAAVVRLVEAVGRPNQTVATAVRARRHYVAIVPRNSRRLGTVAYRVEPRIRAWTRRATARTIWEARRRATLAVEIARRVFAARGHPRVDGGRGAFGGTNRLLETLPAPHRDRLMAALTHVRLAPRIVLFQPGQAIDVVYFPSDCLVSLVTPFKDGSAVEVASVGSEGIVGVPVVLGGSLAVQAICPSVDGSTAWTRSLSLTR